MNYLPYTLAAYFLNGVAVLVDKLLLTSKVTNPLIYIFYISLFSLVALLLLPFTSIPSTNVLFLASMSTIFWTTGLYFMYTALRVGRVTRVIPVIGAMVPVILLAPAIYAQSITNNEVLAIVVLIAGLIFLTLTDWEGEIKAHEISYEIMSAVLFAVSYIILREAYLREHFFTVFVWSRLILVPLALSFLFIPRLRHIVFAKKEQSFSFFSQSGALFLFGQASGGISELLLTFSVSLANPALVNSLQGSQYVFLFIASLLLAKRYPMIFKDSESKLGIGTKIIGIICVGFGLYILATSPHMRPH